MEATQQKQPPTQQSTAPKISFPEFFDTVRREITKEKMVKKTPEGLPNIIDVQFEVSDETGQYILYVRVATKDDKEIVLPYIVEKLQKHEALGQEFDLQHPSAVDQLDFFYLIQFPRR